MADQGLWFKLWMGWDEDPDIGNLSDTEQLAWIRLGCYLKKHGNDGMICLSKPAVALQRTLRLGNYEDVILMLQKLPNIVINEKHKNETVGLVTLTIEWKNWSKYQGDYSTHRVTKWREMKRFKKRREENKKEKENIYPTLAEVQEFAKAENLPLDCPKFFNHFESKGWFSGKSKIKNWKAAARNAASDWARVEAKGIPTWMQANKI